MAIEIVDFPIKNGGSFNSLLLVYQRVNWEWNLKNGIPKMILLQDLVGGIPTPLKNIFVSWDDDIFNMMGKS